MPQDEEVLADLCAAFPVLKKQAASARERADLERCAAEVLAGGSAVRALASLEWTAVEVEGQYVCRYRRCSRVGRANTGGHPPTCGLDSQTMRFE